jgi:hypothetical protein
MRYTTEEATMSKIQYYAVKRVGDRVAEVLVTRVGGRQTDELLVTYHPDDETAIEAMGRHNAALFNRDAK